MSTTCLDQSPASGADPLVLLAETPGSFSIAAVARHPWDRWLAWSRALHLDGQLAAGRSPDSDRLAAVRARMLVAPRARWSLARDWEHLLAVAGEPSRAISRRAPFLQSRIVAAESDIHQLIEALRNNGPVPVRGVAMANLLLIDGSGPVYQPAARPVLHEAVQAAISHLDPYARLLPLD